MERQLHLALQGLCVPSRAPGLLNNYTEFLTLASILCPDFTVVGKPTLAHKTGLKRQV